MKQQMRGHIRLVEAGTEWDMVRQRYCAKFPFVSELKDLLTANSLFAFSPHRIRPVDNRRGFGFKKEWGSLRFYDGE